MTMFRDAVKYTFKKLAQNNNSKLKFTQVYFKVYFKSLCIKNIFYALKKYTFLMCGLTY